MSVIKNEIVHFKKHRELSFLVLPGLLFILVFNYIPMFGIVIAFKDFNYAKGIFRSDWVWFENFSFFFTSQDAFRITKNTILYNLAFIVFGTVVSVAFALVLNELGKKAVKLFQTAFLIPYFLSWVVVSAIISIFLNTDLGVINNLIAGITGNRFQFYNDPTYWPAILLISNLWKGVGYSGVIYYAALIGIDPTYYEAAKIDGATKLQQIVRISLPMLQPLIILLSLLAVGKIFYSDFGLFYFVPMNSGILYETTDVIDTYVYRALRGSGDIGMASAAGLYQSFVGFILVLFSNRLVKRFDESSSLF